MYMKPNRMAAPHAGVDQNMSENFMLSKVFSDAMGPSKVIPYYFKAKAPFDTEDITIATLVTRDRFPVLSRLVTHYQGKTVHHV